MIESLLNRASIPARQLDEPAPDDAMLATILQCALSAPDHAAMHPWRFIVIRGAAREALADVFEAAARAENPDVSDSKLATIREKPLRSPLIVVIVATITRDHPKTPEVEQLLSAGAAAEHVQLAAAALGFGSIWLTGPNAYDPSVKKALGVAEPDQVVGFIYIGTPTVERPVRKRPALEAHVTEWQAPLA